MSQQTVDWFRLIWDMVQRGINVSMIANRTGIPESAIRTYIAGAHPPHWRGELLIREWIKATGKPREEAHTEIVRLTVRIVPSPKTQRFCNGDKAAALSAAGRKVKHG